MNTKDIVNFTALEFANNVLKIYNNNESTEDEFVSDICRLCRAYEKEIIKIKGK